MKKILINYISEQVPDDFADEEIDVDEDLLGSGILDSLGMMKFISFIETEFKVSVPPEDMVIENFMTIEHVSTYIASKL